MQEVADCLTQLPSLTSIDEATRQDLVRARNALRDQCAILRNVGSMQP